MVDDSDNTAGPDSGDAADRLTMTLSPSVAGAVGYGMVYNCDVVTVEEGSLEQDELTLTVLAPDRAVEEIISAHESPDQLVIEFRKVREDEQTSIAMITGFVDTDHVVWEVEDIRETP